MSNNGVTLKPSGYGLNVASVDRSHTLYDFLSVSNCSYMYSSILYHFQFIWCWI